MEQLKTIVYELAMGSQGGWGGRQSEDFLDLVKSIAEARSKAEEHNVRHENDTLRGWDRRHWRPSTPHEEVHAFSGVPSYGGGAHHSPHLHQDARPRPLLRLHPRRQDGPYEFNPASPQHHAFSDAPSVPCGGHTTVGFLSSKPCGQTPASCSTECLTCETSTASTNRAGACSSKLSPASLGPAAR